MSEPSRHYVYCDESRQNSEKFMVFGGVIVDALDRDRILRRFGTWRVDHSMYGEMKWGKVSRFMLPRYKEFIDIAFDLMEANDLHFKSMVVDTTQIDYKTYHDGDHELGFHKFYGLFLIHKFGLYAQSDLDRLAVCMDRRTSSQSLDVLKQVVNRAIRKRFNRRVNVVSSIEAFDSKSNDLLQVADVIMGAIGWHCNRLHDRFDCSPARKEMADYIAKRAQLSCLDRRTPFGRLWFEIWRWKPKEKRPGA